jgi:tetratricopeptide (TPR) repeat protein
MTNRFHDGLLIAFLLLTAIQPVWGKESEIEKLFEETLKNDSLEENRANLQKIIELAPDSAHGHFSKGWFWTQEENYQMAASEYQAALQIHPQFGEARNNLASAYFNLGKWADSIREYENVLRQHPDWSETHLSLGCAFYKSRNIPAAIEAWNKAIQLNSDLFITHYYLGLVYEKIGRRSEARLHYQTFLQMQSDEEEFKKHIEHAMERQQEIWVEEGREKI